MEQPGASRLGSLGRQAGFCFLRACNQMICAPAAVKWCRARCEVRGARGEGRGAAPRGTGVGVGTGMSNASLRPDFGLWTLDSRLKTPLQPMQRDLHPASDLSEHVRANQPEGLSRSGPFLFKAWQPGQTQRQKISQEKSWRQECPGVKRLLYGRLFINYVRVEPQ